MKLLSRLLIGVLAVLIAGAVALAIMLPPGGLSGALLLWRVTGNGATLADAFAPEALREVGGWVGRNGTFRQGDIYQPRGTAKAVLVLVPGASPQGRNDSRLVIAANGLAKSGFIVLVPEIANFRRLRIEDSDIDLIGDAILAAADRPQGSRVALLAASYALPPTIKAAMQAETRDLVGLVVGVGGVYDSVETAKFLVTGGTNPFGTWSFLAIHADLVADPADRTTLSAIAARRLADPSANVDDLTASLGEEGKAVFALATARDEESFDEAKASLPTALAERLVNIGLAGSSLDALNADVILIHGRRDRIVPSTEAESLAQALKPDQARVILLDGLDHADPASLRKDDLIGAISAAGALMQWRDAGE
ncbi:alpha/beta hydrolase family protein [Lacibacterium aquatile]|uniref:Alpha/beta hydrolase family protein n=1 Tax=Lacibacterium aquatile TaxID=1168082 RepID=A0ABW5DTA6_9PROT